MQSLKALWVTVVGYNPYLNGVLIRYLQLVTKPDTNSGVSNPWNLTMPMDSDDEDLEDVTRCRLTVVLSKGGEVCWSILKGWGRFDLEGFYGPWWVSKVFLLIVCLDHRCISQVLHPYFEDNSNLPFF